MASRSIKARLLVLGVGTALVALLVPATSAFAITASDFSVSSPATGGANIPSTNAGGAWTSLVGPSITVAPTQTPTPIVPAVPLVLSLPGNFEFNPAITVPPMVSSGCQLTATAITYSGAGNGSTVAQVGIAGTHNPSLCTITFGSLQVRPISASGGSGGNITVTASGVSIGIGGLVTMAAPTPSPTPVPITPPIITPATGGANIPAATAAQGGSGVWTTLTGPTITESVGGQLANAQLLLTLPANFEFNANITRAPSLSSGCGYTASAILYFGAGFGAQNAQVNLTGTASNAPCTISFGQLLQVRPVSSSAGTGGNMTLSINSSPAGNAGVVTMAVAVTPPPSGPLNLTAFSPTMNNHAIIWGQSYVDLTTTGRPGTVFQIQASTDQSTWPDIRDSSGAVLNFTIGSSGSSVFRYTPVRNYWYRSVSGSTISASQPRVTVRQTCTLRPNAAGTTTVARGSSTTFRALVRPTGSALPRATVIFQIYQQTGSGWALSGSRSVVSDVAGDAFLTWTWSTPGRWYVQAQAQPTSVNANSFWTPAVYYAVP